MPKIPTPYTRKDNLYDMGSEDAFIISKTSSTKATAAPKKWDKELKGSLKFFNKRGIVKTGNDKYLDGSYLIMAFQYKKKCAVIYGFCLLDLRTYFLVLNSQKDHKNHYGT